MDKIIIQIENEYKWTREYAQNVSMEYIKFMELRSKNPKLSPSNDVDKFWHQHILNTVHYRNFCNIKFRKFIDHDPEDANDVFTRNERLNNTIKTYNNTYSIVPPSKIWNNNTPETSIKIIYTFDTYTDNKFKNKSPRKDSGFKYDNIIITVPMQGTVKNLKKIIGEKTNHNPIAMRLVPDMDTYYKRIGQNMSIGDDVLLQTQPNSLILILEEMSHNGYC